MQYDKLRWHLSLTNISKKHEKTVSPCSLRHCRWLQIEPAEMCNVSTMKRTAAENEIKQLWRCLYSFSDDAESRIQYLIWLQWTDSHSESCRTETTDPADMKDRLHLGQNSTQCCTLKWKCRIRASEKQTKPERRWSLSTEFLMMIMTPCSEMLWLRHLKAASHS